MITREKLLKKAEILREEYKKECEAFHWEMVETGNVEERFIPAIPEIKEPTRVLIYTPLDGEAGKMPLFISIHGGAFIRGSADFDDHFCRQSANEARCKVINVDFHLAPEYRFPYSVEECYGVVKWACENHEMLGIDPDKIIVGGHNSGATIAAVVAMLVRDRKECSIRSMLLDCPVITLEGGSMLEDFELEAPLVGLQKGAFFNTCYLDDLANATDPMASPSALKDLSGLPDAFILGASEDPQMPLTTKYAERLKEAGVKVEYHVMDGCRHGFTVRAGLAPKEKFDEAWKLMNTYIRDI